MWLEEVVAKETLPDPVGPVRDEEFVNDEDEVGLTVRGELTPGEEAEGAEMVPDGAYGDDVLPAG